MAGCTLMRFLPNTVLTILLGACLPFAPLGAQPKPKTPAAVPAQATPAQAAPVQAASGQAASVQAPEVPAAPQQTTATFGDWILRCTLAAPVKSCEIVQGISSQDRAVAQIAVGRPAKGQPLQLTILVPPSVSFTGPAAFGTTRDGDAPMLELTWLRCLPGGCMATNAITDDLLRRIRSSTEPARILFVDGAGRRIALPFSPRGLPQALDALAKGDAE